MKRTGILALAFLAVATFALSDFADAKRLGGGRSLGTQRQSVAPQSPTPPAAAPSGAASQPVMPAQAGAATAKPAAAPALSGASRWLGPIAGLAAGLGLAALLSHFGLSEGFASFLLMALVAVGVVFIVRMLLARRVPAKRPLQYAGASSLGNVPAGYETQSPAPAWGGAAKIEPVMPAQPAPAISFAKPLPPGFDVEGFVNQAKLQFNRLQAAYDTADRSALSDVMTPEMFAEISRDLAERGDHRATEVVTLNAEVLEVATEGRRYLASVRFMGMLRESGEPLPKAFDEVWNLTKPVDGSSGWLLAGIEQLT